MLVPELQDIAEQLSIPNYKNLDKQELVDKVLDKQATMNETATSNEEEGKPKRKRIVKPATVSAEEVPAIQERTVPEPKAKKTESPKKPVKKSLEPAPPYTTNRREA